MPKTSRHPIAALAGGIIPVFRQHRLAAVLCVASVLLAATIGTTACVRTAGAVSVARTAVSRSGGPAGRDLRVAAVDLSLTGDGSVTLRAEDSSEGFVVRFGSGKVSGVYESGPDMLVIGGPDTADAARPEDGWEVTAWEPEKAIESTVTTTAAAAARPVADGVAVAVLPSTTATTEPTETGTATEAARPAAAPATGSIPATPATAATAPATGTVPSTGTLLVPEAPCPSQYTVTALPGSMRTAADAFLLPEEWLSMTAELASRTGFQAEETRTAAVTYDGYPAVLGYARYAAAGRTREHFMLLVFLPESGRMVLVAGQRESVTATSAASAGQAPAAEEGTPSAGAIAAATVPVLPQVADDAGIPAAALEFARGCGLRVSGEAPVTP